MMLFRRLHADACAAIAHIARTTRSTVLRTKAACPAVNWWFGTAISAASTPNARSLAQQVLAEITKSDPDVVVMSGSYGVGNQSPPTGPARPPTPFRGSPKRASK